MMDECTTSYFKSLAQEIGVPYQTLINLYLRDCAVSHKKLALHWKTAWFYEAFHADRPDS